MTEDEAIIERMYAHWLYEIPKEYHTKEFVLKCVYEHQITSFTTDEIIDSGIVIDYDIALALLYGCYDENMELQDIRDEFDEYLTNEEINKLYTTLKLMGDL